MSPTSPFTLYEGVLIANGDSKTTASEIKMARCRVEMSY